MRERIVEAHGHNDWAGTSQRRIHIAFKEKKKYWDLKKQLKTTK